MTDSDSSETMGETVPRQDMCRYVPVQENEDNDNYDERRRMLARKRRYKERKGWMIFGKKLNDNQFLRYFRMPRDCFDQLCQRIEANVGSLVFKSEQFLQDLNDDKTRHKTTKQMNTAHLQSTGGFISGEIKVAITLRLLAGGTYMDLALLYEVSFSYSYSIFHYVINNWINDEKFVSINGDQYLKDDALMSKVANDFAIGSNGLIKGAIGAIDGWLVRIKKPKVDIDQVRLT